MRRIIITVVCGFGLVPAVSQPVNYQLWTEVMLNQPIGKVFNLEHGLTYSTLFNKPRWRAFDYSACFEWAASKHADISAQTVISYTNQIEGVNTLEIRPLIGARIHFTPDNRILTRLLLRLEDRNIKDLEAKTWSVTMRPRARAEVIVPINKTRYSQDGVYYALTDIEWLYANDEVKERFANRLRLRFGLGYRVSYSTRFEFIYMLQKSRDQINDPFNTSDHIFRLRFKYYFAGKPSAHPEGTGN